MKTIALRLLALFLFCLCELWFGGPTLRAQSPEPSLMPIPAHVTMGDMQIFEQWKLTSEPVLLIGMDTLGLLDTLIIDYRRRELQIQMHSW